MATDGPTPKPCDPDIFKNGEGVCVLDGSSNAIERWVKSVAKKADAKVDWHYSGGRANVLHLGDDASRQRVFNAIEELKEELDGTILNAGGPALYRDGVESNPSDGRNPEQGAVVREINGQLVLDDPDALTFVRVINKNNCGTTLKINEDRVAHFKRRIIELGKTAKDVVIVLLNVDDVHGAQLADVLMPGFNWQEIRDRGETPYARGLAKRDGIQEAIDILDKEAGEKLRLMDDVAVVIVDYGVAEVFPA